MGESGLLLPWYLYMFDHFLNLVEGDMVHWLEGLLWDPYMRTRVLSMVMVPVKEARRC